MDKKRRKRQAISLKVKLKVIEDYEQGLMTVEAIASKYELKNRSNVYQIVNDKDKIKEKAKQIDEDLHDKVKTLKTSTFPQLETALKLWVIEMRRNNWPVNMHMISEEANWFADQLGIVNFKASTGFVQKFSARNRFDFGELHGEGGSVNEVDVQKWLKNLKEVFLNYKPEDIFNADETGLFWRMLPTRSYKLKTDVNRGIKKSKERVTVLLITNMTGTKREIAVIGKSANPRGFNKKKSKVNYYNQESAWMNSIIFEDILKKLNRKMKSENRKILMFLDNVSFHEGLNFSNIEIKFFPPNATAKLQPLDQGIIYSFKSFYRKKLLSFLLTKIRENIKMKMTEIKFAKAMDMIYDAWTQVTNTTIQNCFEEAGIKQNEVATRIETIDELSETLWDEFQEQSDDIGFACFDEYVNYDSDLECKKCFNKEEIVEIVKEKFNETELNEKSNDEVQESDESDVDFEFEVPTHSQTLDALHLVQQYAIYYGIDEEFGFSKFEDKIAELSVKNKKQTKITDFFAKSN